MTSFERMIVQQYPYAEPGEDFKVKTGEDGNPTIGYWNAIKLGAEPNIIALHANYMRWAAKKKEVLPKFDDSDPAPWLNADHSSAYSRGAVSKPAEQAETEHNYSGRATLPTVTIYPNGVIAHKHE